MSKLTLVFSDGDTCAADVRVGETLLAAAKRAGVALASDCEVGDCQTCRARVTAGEAVYDEYASISLTSEEVAAGEVLTCVATADEDIIVSLPYDRAHLLPARPFSLKVVSVERLCASVVRVVVRTTGRGSPTFLPGQYVNLKVPGTGQWRSYSMANAPDAGSASEFLVRLLDDGVMSRYLLERATPDDLIEAKGPYGTFYRRVGTRSILMIAGGTGLAPMASMLRAMIATGDRRPVTLCFGVTRAEDLFYLDQLSMIGEELPSLDVRIAIMNGDAAGHASGTAVDLVRREDVTGRDIYLCGPPAMADRARAVVKDHGAAPENIFVERFVPVAEAESAATASKPLTPVA